MRTEQEEKEQKLHQEYVHGLQWRSSFCVLTSGFCMGITQTITSGILNEEPWISYSSASKGVITSSLILGAAVGCFIGGAVLNKFGRKITLTISTIFIFLFGMLCGFFGNIYCLLIFRMICGLGVGLAKIAAQLFITEVAQIINIDENAKTREEYSSVKTEQEKLKELKKKKKEMKKKLNKKKSGDAFRERIMAVDQTSITFGILLANIISFIFNSFRGNCSENYETINYQQQQFIQAFRNSGTDFSMCSSWRYKLMVSSIPGLVFFIGSLTIKESDKWKNEKIKKNKEKKSELKQEQKQEQDQQEDENKHNKTIMKRIKGIYNKIKNIFITNDNNARKIKENQIELFDVQQTDQIIQMYEIDQQQNKKNNKERKQSKSNYYSSHFGIQRQSSQESLIHKQYKAVNFDDNKNNNNNYNDQEEDDDEQGFELNSSGFLSSSSSTYSQTLSSSPLSIQQSFQLQQSESNIQNPFSSFNNLLESPDDHNDNNNEDNCIQSSSQQSIDQNKQKDSFTSPLGLVQLIPHASNNIIDKDIIPLSKIVEQNTSNESELKKEDDQQQGKEINNEQINQSSKQSFPVTQQQNSQNSIHNTSFIPLQYSPIKHSYQNNSFKNNSKYSSFDSLIDSNIYQPFLGIESSIQQSSSKIQIKFNFDKSQSKQKPQQKKQLSLSPSIQSFDSFSSTAPFLIDNQQQQLQQPQLQQQQSSPQPNNISSTTSTSSSSSKQSQIFDIIAGGTLSFLSQATGINAVVLFLPLILTTLLDNKSQYNGIIQQSDILIQQYNQNNNNHFISNNMNYNNDVQSSQQQTTTFTIVILISVFNIVATIVATLVVNRSKPCRLLSFGFILMGFGALIAGISQLVIEIQQIKMNKIETNEQYEYQFGKLTNLILTIFNINQHQFNHNESYTILLQSSSSSETTNHLPSLIICAVGVCLFITGFRFGAGPLAPQTVIDICNGKRRKIRKENGSDNSIDQDTIQMRGINAPLKIAQDSEVKVEAPEKEMKSISWRNTAIGIASSFSWVGSVFISTAFLPIVDRISFGGGFLFLAFINFIGFVFSLTFVQ